MASQEESSSSGYSDMTWIQWFCGMEGHEFFVEVEEDYINDTFNLYGLKAMFPQYQEAIELILSPTCPDEEEMKQQSYLELYQEAADLYGLIHARFIISQAGMELMREKYLAGSFGLCPRVMCEKQPVLPIGISEELRTSRVKLYCPKCQDIYFPKQKLSDVDGAYFGTSFPHLFFLNFPDILIEKSSKNYAPKLYGFKLYGRKGSKYESNYNN
jgi:casein kinase II subunit beta